MIFSFAGIGGDAFALMYKASDKSVSAVMGSGRSPKRMTLNVRDLFITLLNINPMISQIAGQVRI